MARMVRRHFSCVRRILSPLRLPFPPPRPADRGYEKSTDYTSIAVPAFASCCRDRSAFAVKWSITGPRSLSKADGRLTTSDLGFVRSWRRAPPLVAVREVDSNPQISVGSNGHTLFRKLEVRCSPPARPGDEQSPTCWRKTLSVPSLPIGVGPA